mgnify:CR=1 FL=1
MGVSKEEERKVRARDIVAYLKKTYPNPKTELQYETPFQLLVAVVLSAQCTDKMVNRVTETLFKKYKTPYDFAHAGEETLAREISSVTFFRAKARYVIGAAQIIERDFKGTIPKTIAEFKTLPGVAYKTATVVLGELYDIWDGIPTDTHVKRFAYRFDRRYRSHVFPRSWQHHRSGNAYRVLTDWSSEQ